MTNQIAKLTQIQQIELMNQQINEIRIDHEDSGFWIQQQAFIYANRIAKFLAPFNNLGLLFPFWVSAHITRREMGIRQTVKHENLYTLFNDDCMNRPYHESNAKRVNSHTHWPFNR